MPTPTERSNRAGLRQLNRQVAAARAMPAKAVRRGPALSELILVMVEIRMPRRSFGLLLLVAITFAIAGCFGSSDLPTAPSPPPPGTVKEAPTGKEAVVPADVLKKKYKAAPRGTAKGGAKLGGAVAN